MPNKMERFTQRARRVLSLAQEEAERLQHNYIGTEHVLLGLMREEGGIAGRVLRDLGLEHRRVEELVGKLTRATTREETTQIDLSPGTKRVLELAVDEARRMGHHYIGTEHLLLGLVRQSEGVAIDVLKRLRVSPEEVRRQTRRVLQESPVQRTPPSESEPGERADLFAALQLRLQTRMLPRLLMELAQSLDEAHKTQVQAMVEQLFSTVLAEQGFAVSETERIRLLEFLISPFKPIDESKRYVHLVIKEKTSSEIYADFALPVAQVREGMKAFTEALNEGRTGKLLDINDDANHNIVISVDEQPSSGSEGAGSKTDAE